MSVLSRLATALGRNDERPNVELAEALVAEPDNNAIAELVRALSTASQAVRNDAIKVLYEIGERRPDLLDGYANAFFKTLKSRNNHMVWGGLSALAAIATMQAPALAARLPEILAAADRSSVIAKDKAMSILAQLAAAGYAEAALPMLLDRLETAAPNQFPMYAELAAPVVDVAREDRLRRILETRLAGIPQPAKRARIEKVLRRLNK
jgi:HEAT repeat protein